MKYELLNKSILQGEDTLYLAKYLLGKILISKIDGKECVTRIVETEAYKAPEDKGSHAYNNKRTSRTEVMFHSGGISYVYLCYGIHNMLNVVTGPVDEAHAILIRAVEPLSGLELMRERRNSPMKQLTNGPGKLSKALGITRSHNNLDLCDMDSPIYLCDHTDIPQHQILEGPRVGIAYAEECALWPWRFRIKDNPWTSLPDKVVY